MLPEPWNSVALVVAGAVLGALASGLWCGCLGRIRWRRQWRVLAERNGRPFAEMGDRRSEIGDGRSEMGAHTARFIMQQVAARNEQRARELARRAGTEGAR